MRNASGMALIGNGGCKMNEMPPDDYDIKLTAGDDLSTHYTIQRTPNTKGIRALSVPLAPDGNDKDEF